MSPGNSGQSNRLPPTLMTVTLDAVTPCHLRCTSRYRESRAGICVGSKPFRSEFDQGKRTAGRRRDGSPGFPKANDRAVRLNDPAGQPPAPGTRPNPTTTAAAGRPMVGRVARSAACTRRWIRHSSAAWANARRRPAKSRRGRRRPSGQGGRGPASTVAGRPSAVDRSLGLDAIVSQREINVERRGKDLGRQAGGDPAKRQLGRQCTHWRSAHARINQLAGLEAPGIATPPRGHDCRDQAGSDRSLSSRCRSRGHADSGIDRAAKFASASQFAAAARWGCRRASATE